MFIKWIESNVPMMFIKWIESNFANDADFLKLDIRLHPFLKNKQK